MKKEIYNKSLSLWKIIFLSLTIFLAFFLFVPKARASIGDVCDYDDKGKLLKFLFKRGTYCTYKIFVSPDTDASDTVGTIFWAAAVDVPLGVTMNTNGDSLGMCGAYLTLNEAEDLGLLDSDGNVNIESQDGSTSLISHEEVDSIREFGENNDCEYNSTKVGSRSNGSFAGVAMTAYNTATTEPVPVNLAYYAKHNLQKVPIIGDTAFAQTSIYDSFGLKLFLEVWEVSRNLAYALLSVIMLVIGIMISTGKKINPQTIVTAQTALPRVVISLVLITFSYPIGAVFASSVLPLTYTMYKLFFNEAVYNRDKMFGGQSGQLINMNGLIVVASTIILLFGTAGVGLLLGAILLLLTVVALFVAGVKLLIINVKIILQIITAPIQFAIAAVPGQEHLIGDWFKQMIAKVLSIPAIIFMISLAWYVLLKPFSSAESIAALTLTQFSDMGSFMSGFGFFAGMDYYGTIAITFVLLSMMSIMIMFVGLKADKKVEEFIMGGDKRGKR